MTSLDRIDGLDEVRDLARRGDLAATIAAADGTRRRALAGALYAIAWPVVFQHLTRKLELRRGHMRCASSVRHLTDDCLDHFHDDVEAVVEDITLRAVRPIGSLEAWVTSRLTAATVDGHRRRRGEIGALQRPRLPGWLLRELGGDEWLGDLAIQVLTWVGTPATAGTDVWPTEAWMLRHNERTGRWTTYGVPEVSRDITTVLHAMRRRPEWYERYVETPLGHKQAPLAGDAGHELPALPAADADAVHEAALRRLAHEAVALIAVRLGRGEPARTVVGDVVRAVFGDGLPALDAAPHLPDGGDAYLLGLLRDPAALDRITAAALSIVEG